MGDYYQMTISDWLASKTEEIRQELGKTAQSFVAIGYKLKEVRDSGNLAEGETIADYAQREFGLSASTTSRFIAINEKFGDGLELKSEYLKFGSGKLQEMLTLSDADCELINQNHTVTQIREVKRFETEDNGPVAETPVQQHTAVEKCIIDYFKDKPKLLNDICLAEYLEADDYKRAADMISPNGSTTHKKGIVFMFMYQFDEGIKYKIFGEQSARQMSYIEFINTIRDIFSCAGDVNPHKAFYGEIKAPEHEPKSTVEPVATSQLEEVTESDTHATENNDSVSSKNESHDFDNENSEVENESHDYANDSCGDDNGEVEDDQEDVTETDMDSTDVDSEPEEEDVECVSGTVEDFVNDSHAPTPIEIELAECINLLDGWRAELCKPELTSQGVRELKDNMIVLISQASVRLASALWEQETKEEDEGE